MKKEIIINSGINEVRVAITEDGKLAEYLIDLPDKERYIGNIYLGRVNKIIQSINAAFINIGLKQDAFLHFSDVDESLEHIITDEEDDDIDDNQPVRKAFKYKQKKDEAAIALRKESFNETTPNGKLATFKTKRSGEIQINLKPKQSVLVQVVREAYGNKGVKVTTKIALPGRYMVLLPFDSLLGVSRKINSIHERRRLRKLVRGFVNKNDFGCIIRTAAKKRNEEDLRKDWENLYEVWQEIEQKVQKANHPMLVYQDMQLANSVIRDLFNYEVRRLVVDSKKFWKEIRSYLKTAAPNLLDKLELYNGTKPIFEHYGLENEISKTFKRHVNLPGGGDIVFDHAEAMLVIDVNSGRSVDKDQEKNAFKNNMEALYEISRQLRLRDIGGIIIVDFIDMAREQNRKKVFQEMKKELYRDRAKTVVYPITQLGLMQITRQRINQNISEKTSDVCPMCNGKGRVTSRSVLLNSIERWLKNFRINTTEFRLVLHVHPHMAAYLTEGTISSISKLMIKYFVKIKVMQKEDLPIDHFRFVSVRQQKDITSEYL